MARTFTDARRWMTEGTDRFLDAVSGLSHAFAAPTLLPGWTRKHLVAHVAANAEAVGRLVRWAATGVETPMYRSPEERSDGIAQGATMTAHALESWLATSAEILAAAMDRLPEDAWRHEVVTAQGRTVPAAETPWMRAREVCVHVVDLDCGIGFAELPEDFNQALCDDIRAKRNLGDLPAGVAAAPLPELTAWLAGRPYAIPGVPPLAPWL
ncbi:maleylpyruvate isomerase family mycothiol-dependent enzyme (plasmid) [Streptomycetaceae bacterium NBC_01309]